MNSRPAIIFALVCLLSCCSLGAAARETASSSKQPQTVDTLTVKRNFFQRVFDYFDRSAVDKTFEKRMDFTFLGGPSYSSKTSLSIGILAAGLYRTDRTDTLSLPSNVSLFGNFAISGYYYIGISGNTFFKQNRHRLDYELGFRSQPSEFWGLGYDAAMYNPAGSYTAKKYLVNLQYKYAVVQHTYIGALADFNHTDTRRLTVEEYLNGQQLGYTATGLGLFVEYDSRDSVTQPFDGWYVNFTATIYPKGMGTCRNTFWRMKMTVDWYRRLWKGAVLAFDLYGEVNTSKAPWTMYAMLGSNQRMRGYYEGRFNDLNIITAQLELRQRIYRRIGCTVWGGGGNVFSSFGQFDWSHTLPNYGVGLRWELKKRMNIRLDYGFGKKVQGELINGFIMSINEAF